jgi:hypothetical protein
VTSTEHYQAAEKLLQRKPLHHGPVGLDVPEDRPPTPEEVAQARAHATLALVNVTEGLLHELSTLRQHLAGN